MEQIKQELNDESALLEKFGAEQTFGFPDTYGTQGSYYGEGRYPPDWAHRRRAIWWLQDDRCGRCGCEAGDEGHVHHVTPLADGGTNRLENLVGVCNDCHALFHPTVRDLNGDWREAPKLPSERAQEEIAVIKRERLGADRDTTTGVDLDLEKLEAETASRTSTHASQSPAAFDIPLSLTRELSQASDSRSVLETLNGLLLRRGRVPENEAHDGRRLEIDTSQTGVLGWLSSFDPTVDVAVSETRETEGPVETVCEEVGPDDTNGTELLFSENVTEAVVEVTGGDGEVIDERVAFTDETPTRSVSVSVSPPPLSLSTLGTYAWNVGQKSLLLPILYGLLWLTVVPAAGVVLLFSLLGTVAGAVGLVGWATIAIFFGGSWSTVGQMAVATVLSLGISSIAIVILEQFGIDLGE